MTANPFEIIFKDLDASTIVWQCLKNIANHYKSFASKPLSKRKQISLIFKNPLDPLIEEKLKDYFVDDRSNTRHIIRKALQKKHILQDLIKLLIILDQNSKQPTTHEILKQVLLKIASNMLHEIPQLLENASNTFFQNLPAEEMLAYKIYLGNLLDKFAQPTRKKHKLPF